MYPDEIKNTLSVERKARKEDFFLENLNQCEDGKHKRKIKEDSFNGVKRPRYDSVCQFCKLPLKEAILNCFSDSSFPTSTSKRESIILKNENLNIFSEDEKPQVKLTSFSVYDKAGHLCSFDNDLLKNGVTLYAAGYVKPIHDENSNICDGLPVRKIGPIISWWLAGFDGGEKAIIGISTDIADYYLMKPSEKYDPYLKEIHAKMYMVKLVIEFLEESEESEATYDNLLHKLQITVPPPGFKTLSEENLLMYAGFIYDHVISYDSFADESNRLFVNTPCLRHLALLSGISVSERLSQIRYQKRTVSWLKKNNEMTKATTTNLVENVFETFFPDQMDKSINFITEKMKECKVLLERCDYDDYQSDEEDIIDHTLSLPESPPTPLKELRIVLKRWEIDPCLNEKDKSNYGFGRPFSIVLEAMTDEIIKKYTLQNDVKSDTTSKRRLRKLNYRESALDDDCVEWIGEPYLRKDGKRQYREAIILGSKIQAGDFVDIGDNSESNNQIGRIMFMYEDDDEKLFHIHYFIKSCDTVLGEIGDEQELFDSNECDDLPLEIIQKKVKVDYLEIPHASWTISGNSVLNDWYSSRNTKDRNCFIYQKRYNPAFGRFEDVEDFISKGVISDFKSLNHCLYCERNREEELSENPVVDMKLKLIPNTNEYSYGLVRWRNEEFKVGTCVFLTPGTLFPIKNKSFKVKEQSNKIDEERYPELYRKNKERHRVEEIVEPFNIGCIVSIRASKKPESAEDVFLTVKKFYRPQNTHLDDDAVKILDLNLLYWSDEEHDVTLQAIEGKCYVANSKHLSCPIDEWRKKGPHRFHYEEAYNEKDKKFISAPTALKRQNDTYIDLRKSDRAEAIIEENPIEWPFLSRPLRCLDIFAGCGGLTEGLHQAGVADSRWAIEIDEAAAHAFRLNYPNAAVYTEDCNDLLKLIMNGQTKKDGQSLPQKGEVELLCGGPPCQGFSRMNRFTNRQYSCFKNSLVVSFLSYADYYRPRYIIMENVRNFVLFKKNMVLKLTLRCLLKMGYQCTFGVVQAGHFGVPQNRRRAIIFAAAPGEILPNFPEPINTFAENAISVYVDGQKISNNMKWNSSAPLRKLTVYDAISDLPPIESGGDPFTTEMPYENKPKSDFQRNLRKSNDLLRDHVSKPLNPLVEKRISFIPRKRGSDWRDLPNIRVELSDGTYARKLLYTHHDKQNGKSKSGSLRGVCSCATGKKKCSPEFRQMDTLIPWCLPHTGNRNHHWAGLYGRIEWDNHFKTVITNLDPMCKQGSVIHPQENRVISVREVARSQGFSDKFRFFGSTQDRYRQIGNAVPPPLAAALGREIAKAVSSVKN